MDKKFNVGDRVRSKFYGIVGTVIDVDTDGYIIEPDHVEEMWIAEEDAEAYDRKTDFLTRLSELMREFDAEIEYHIGSDEKSDYSEYYAITIGRERLTYDNCEGASLTADNLMDYDKE
ncbi:hypothetical protein [uncultured Muribaculum sp.]|uniref:hypothetical protein n=1 Tax=uncultured Muribaculum sp. TaxID=1918613 RepID=UPI00273229F8|nr:hypothetical protein [uncultured Muribaculum sp.]